MLTAFTVLGCLYGKSQALLSRHRETEHADANIELVNPQDLDQAVITAVGSDAATSISLMRFAPGVEIHNPRYAGAKFPTSPSARIA